VGRLLSKISLRPLILSDGFCAPKVACRNTINDPFGNQSLLLLPFFEVPSENM